MSKSRNTRILIVLIAAVVVIGLAVWLLRPASDNDGASSAGNESPAAEQSNTGSPPADEGEPEEPAEQTSEPKNTDVQTDIPSITETYADYFPIGAALEPNQIEGKTAELIKKHANWIVAENAMKPSSIQPTNGRFVWEQADKLVAFAKENNMELRFHTLVWHNQSPGWFFLDADGKHMADETDPAKREENKKLALERLDTHVRTIVDRYKNDIKSWDVVNEVIEPADPGGMRNSNWYKITGTDYIETAFRAAREAGGPDIKLYINDYNTNEPQKRDYLYNLVKEMLDKGVPIDGVGHQTHINIEWPSVDQIIESMRKFNELGLDNIITELDMSVYVYNDHSDYGPVMPEHILRKQGERYRDLFNGLKANKDLVSGVVFWGIADDHTWLSTFPVTRNEAPLLFDKNHQAKPAYWGVVDPSKLD